MRRFYLALLVTAIAYPFWIFVTARDFAVGGAIIVGTFTVGASLLIGLPLALAFVRKGWLKLWQATVAGATAGVLCSLPLMLGDGKAGLMNWLAPFCAVGAIHGAAFWFLAIFKNQALQRRCVSLR